MKEIFLSDNVWEIARGAFAGCKNLERIHLAGKSREDGSLVFKDGDKLLRYISGQETYVVPDNVRALDNYVFEDCNRLKKVVLHGKMKRLPNHALEKCKTLTVLEIGEGLKKINTKALEGSKIKEIILPTGSVKFFDKYQYQFLVEGKQTVVYDFASAAKNVTRMLAEPATAALAADKSFKIAEDMIKRHAEEVGDELPALVTSALCYWHRAGRSEEDDVSSEKQASWCGKSCGAFSVRGCKGRSGDCCAPERKKSLHSRAAMRRTMKRYRKFFANKERVAKLARLGHRYDAPLALHTDIMAVLAGLAGGSAQDVIIAVPGRRAD